MSGNGTDMCPCDIVKLKPKVFNVFSWIRSSSMLFLWCKEISMTYLIFQIFFITAQYYLRLSWIIFNSQVCKTLRLHVPGPFVTGITDQLNHEKQWSMEAVEDGRESKVGSYGNVFFCFFFSFFFRSFGCS